MNRLPRPVGRDRVRIPLFAALALLVSAAACADSDAALVDQDTLLARLDAQDTELVVLDVRTAEEFAQGHVPGARNISHDELGARLGELAGERDKDLVIYCRSGHRAGIAVETLHAAGFTRLFHLEGDFLGWTAAGRKTEGAAAEPDPET